MANVSTVGLEELFDDLESVIELPDETALAMLTAEAEVVAAAQTAEARAMLSGAYSTGETADSVTYGKKLTTKGDERCLYVYPNGTRKQGNRRRAAEVAYVNEYGKTNQPARQFIRTANEKSAEAAVDAAAKVYDDYLKSKNL